MFTGIIQATSKIRNIEYLSNDKIFCIEPTTCEQNYQRGESIAVNGTCLTLTDFSSQLLKMYASNETLTCTNLSQLKIGHTVNLERALKLNDRLGGHFVSGHIDTQAQLTQIVISGSSKCLTFSIDRQYGHFIIPKGSITLDGISLTVNQCAKDFFSVNIIPETLARTTIATWRQSYSVNVEVDLLSKHIHQYLHQQSNFFNNHG
jgi:riboflavin synthase